jgi:anti-sigma regulatory factor (Ser/Thr protein kinase)
MEVLDLRFPAGPQAPGEARHALDGLTDRVDVDRLDEIRLLVSELVTNSVRHAGLESNQWIGLRVDHAPELLRVEVTDGGPGFEAGKPLPSMYQDSGWGLYLVEQIANRWGVRQEEGTCVWFEIDLA